MSKDQLMVAQLQKLFTAERIDNCLDFDNRKKFYICEDDVSNRSYISEDKGDTPGNGFVIKNSEQKKVYLFAIDNCFFTVKSDYDGKRCDCIVFDDYYLCFVELKLNVLRWRQATRQLREARKQIGDVIEFFREEFNSASNDFLGFELEAFVVMRQNIYPRSRASRNSVFVSFLEKYGVKLFERNYKEF